VVKKKILKREWLSVIAGTVLGIVIIQVVTLILLRSLVIDSFRVVIIVEFGLATTSIFFGGVLAGFIDNMDAGTRGLQTALTILLVNTVANVLVGLIEGRFSFYIYFLITVVIIFTAFIPILLGAIGGQIGGLLSRR
jgi:hypothetical protein